MNQGNDQIIFFNDANSKNINNNPNDTQMSSAYSKRIYNSFKECNFKFSLWAMNLPEIYRDIVKVIPDETISFSLFPIKTAILCEFISAAICHQINWDYIRSKIKDRVKVNPKWITTENLSKINEFEIRELLSDYHRTERIDAIGRTKILRELADTYKETGFERIFYSKSGLPNGFEYIRQQLLCSKTFSGDFVEKKLQLLLMKLSAYDDFKSFGNKCKPTIDYHLIRMYIRRGFLMPRNSSSINFVFSDTIHRENTLAAVRKHCANIVYSLRDITGLNIVEINLADWWIGRSVCIEGSPDCLMKKKESQWLKKRFDKCPFYEFCLAQNSDFTQLILDKFEKNKNLDLKGIDSPNYSGNNY